MRILFVGDIVGRSGRAILLDRLPTLVKDWKLDFVAINGENAAGGFGVTMCSSSSFEPDASNRADSPGASSTPAPSSAACDFPLKVMLPPFGASMT